MTLDAVSAMGLHSRHAMGKTSMECMAQTTWPGSRRREPQVVAVRTVNEKSLLSDDHVPVAFNASPLPVADIGVIIGGEDGRVRFLDTTMQREYWVRRLDAGIYSSPVAIPGAADFLVASTGGMVVRFDLRGRAVWTAALSGPVLGTIAFSPDGGTAYVPVFGHRLVALDVASGNTKWTFDTASATYQNTYAYDRAPYASPVVFESGEVVVVDHDDVACLQADGLLQWRARANGIIRSSPTICKDMVVCATTEGVLCRWTRSGTQLADLTMGGRIDGSLASIRELVIVPVRGQGISAVDAVTGARVWHWTGGGLFEYTSLVLGEEQTVLFTSDRGTVCCLDACSGAFLWESSQIIGRPDHPTAVHTSPMPCGDGSLYVASYDGDCYRFDHPMLEDPESGQRP
ncbi:PQQ-binding-like beta-propeller repeat protein [Arthrobacter sp. Rue61a]|uniref:outer membrane protein assembly factor BamB family protein n=1 Tax=Arthrobacter sp. Rue61a TaxID=1118963 RepID=UPI00027DF474|nr:PQQ-binding-like beta-propeller repeat protein [Arthrobacter sp. Rue61a]AFR30788.1 PQQ (pyrrolo-quinoline quinone) enzyme repeat domain protein [Arthrobacter sp. Rue61a]